MSVGAVAGVTLYYLLQGYFFTADGALTMANGPLPMTYAGFSAVLGALTGQLIFEQTSWHAGQTGLASAPH
jgi:hypothetical protein